MTDILFITPNTAGNMNDESVGTLLLAAILRNKALSVDILPFSRIGDPEDFHNFLNSAMEMIRNASPKIVSFYTRCDNYHIMLKLAQQIKKTMDVYIVFGGPQADIAAVDTLRQIPYVDFICCGEGENTVYPFFSSLLQGTPDLTVPGLVYRQSGQIRQNPRPELIADLDMLPDIDYSAFCFDAPVDPAKPFPIDVGRGCPFGCTYCSTKSFWGRKYRLKSPQRIFSEMKQLQESFGISNFGFDHDMFTLNRSLVIETCRLLKTMPAPVSWGCSARIDCIDRELIDIMADAGLHKIYIGIETGSPRMQKIINKNLKLDGIYEMLSYIRSKNITVTASFIYGFPEETEEDISQTLALIAELAKIKGIRIQTHLCTFLPGTELSQQYRSSLTPATTFSDITGTTATAECADLIQAHPDLFWHFREYKTELRTKLEFFKTFCLIWFSMQPVYQYLSEKYPKNRLIDMYYDFVHANWDILRETKTLPARKQTLRIVADDRFAKQFKDDAFFDIIADFYRMMLTEHGDQLEKGSTKTEIYCFSPTEIDRRSCLQEYRRSISIVTYTKGPDGALHRRIRNVSAPNILP